MCRCGAKDYEEVNAVGAADSADRPLDRAEVARLYAALSSGFVLSMATRQIAVAKGMSPSARARSRSS